MCSSVSGVISGGATVSRPAMSMRSVSGLPVYQCSSRPTRDIQPAWSRSVRNSCQDATWGVPCCSFPCALLCAACSFCQSQRSTLAALHPCLRSFADCSAGSTALPVLLATRLPRGVPQSQCLRVAEIYVSPACTCACTKGLLMRWNPNLCRSKTISAARRSASAGRKAVINGTLLTLAEGFPHFDFALHTMDDAIRELRCGGAAAQVAVRMPSWIASNADL